MASANECADALINMMQKHSNSVVENKAITTSNKTGRITGVIDSSNRYEVTINGSKYRFPYRDGLTLSIGDIVIISYYDGDTQKGYIDLKKTWTCW